MDYDLLGLMRWWDFPVHLHENPNRTDDEDKADAHNDGDAVTLEETFLLVVVRKVLIAHGTTSMDATWDPPTLFCNWMVGQWAVNSKIANANPRIAPKMTGRARA